MSQKHAAIWGAVVAAIIVLIFLIAWLFSDDPEGPSLEPLAPWESVTTTTTAPTTTSVDIVITIPDTLPPTELAESILKEPTFTG